jgi:hypothetical protein
VCPRCRKPLRVALKATSDSGIFEGVGAFKAGQTFVPRIDGFGGALLDVTNLMGKVTFESVRWFGRNSRCWTPSFEGFAMIDDMPRLKEAMEQMDAEDPTVAQAAKDRAAQTLSDAKLNFAKMAELIEQRRLLLRPRIVAGIKRMDQPGMLGDAAFRDTGSALRREGQSFRQIAEAIERTDRPAPQYEDPVQRSAPPHQMPSEPGRPAWLRALALVASIVFFPLLHPIRFLAIALLGLFLFYALRGCVPSGQQALGYFDGVAAVRDSAGKAMSSVSSSVSSFVNEYILRKPKGAPPTTTPAAPNPSPPAAAPPSAIPSAAPATAPASPATAPAPPANAPAAAAPPSAAPSAPSAAPAGPPVSTPRRDARGEPPSKSGANRGAAREDRDPRSRCCAPFEDDRPRIEDNRPRIDDRPRSFQDIIPEGIRRHSRTAGRCFGGVGGCSWGGGRY